MPDAARQRVAHHMKDRDGVGRRIEDRQIDACILRRPVLFAIDRSPTVLTAASGTEEIGTYGLRRVSTDRRIL